MKTYKIFLASSFELKPEREKFESFINRENKRLTTKKVFFRLEIWEDMDDAFNTSCKQEDYNEYLSKCDICVVLFWTKMGKYTRQEFELAYHLFLNKGKPRVYVFEKTAAPDTGPLEWEAKSKTEFVDRLKTEGKEQFPSMFSSYPEFENRFKKSLDYLFDKGVLSYGEPARLLSPNAPADPNVFVGREGELKIIRERLDHCGKLMLINAEGGIGKTTLAAKYWNESIYKYSYHAWLFCENGIINAIKELAPQLNVDLTGLEEQEQIAVLKKALLSIHDEFLLVLDNANKEEDIQMFRHSFEGFRWHVLITSRCRGILEEEEEFPITHLSPPIAKALFRKYYEEEGPEFENLLDRLLEAIQYHTLLVEIFSKNMKEVSEMGMSLAGFLEKLESGGLYLGEDSFDIRTSYTGYVKKEAATTDEILNILFDFSHLNEQERYALVNLALIPAENYTLLFLLELFQPEDKIAFRGFIKSLYHKGWLGEGTISIVSAQ